MLGYNSKLTASGCLKLEPRNLHFLYYRFNVYKLIHDFSATNKNQWRGDPR